MYKRVLDLPKLLKNRSYFLFGARGTGKSTLIQQMDLHAKVYDLLNAYEFQRLLRDPTLIGQETKSDTLVVIDEIQKLPQLLDEVHRLIVKKKQTFLLTGSSTRKLRRGGANLLAGRAFQTELLPLISQEIPDFDLLTYLNTTGLPEFYGNSQAHEYIKVKGTDLVTNKHLTGLRALKEEGLIHTYCVVSLDPNERLTSDGIHIWPWQIFLKKLWDNQLFSAF